MRANVHALLISIPAIIGVSGHALAENWAGAPAVPPSYTDFPPPIVPQATLTGEEVIRAECLASFPPIAEVFYCDPPGNAGQRWVRISEFARSSTVADLQTQVSALSEQLSGLESLEARIARIEAIPSIRNHLDHALAAVEKRANAGIAMTAALQPVSPFDDQKNRLSFDTVSFNGQTALGAQYVRKEGQLDFNFGLASSGEDTMARGGVSFSW
jgi:hypothetical protein